MILEFDAYYLSDIQEKDAWKICDFIVANQDRFKLYLPKTVAQNLTPDLSRLFTEKKVKEFQKKEELLFTLKEKETNVLVGLVYLKNFDWNKKQGEFAYCIGYQFKGKAIITKAVNELMIYAQKNLGILSFQIIAHKTNPASVKVAENCGFKWVKTLKNGFTPTGKGPLDMELYKYHYNETSISNF